MFFHWQNLNDMRRGSKIVRGSAWRNGRAWLHFGGQGRDKCLHCEWIFGRANFHVGFDLQESDREILFFFVVPLVGLYLGFEGLRWKWLWETVGRTTREFGISIHGWSVWWNFGQDQMMSTGKEPKWMHWVFDIPKFFFGKRKYEKVTLERKQIEIPLPEGLYLAEAEFQTSTWKRARWPWWPLKHVRNFTDVNVLQYGGLPFEGKGENSWDCGTDGLYGYSVEDHNIFAAVAKGVQSTLENRKRYGGSTRGYYPSPVARSPEQLMPFAKYVARCQRAEAEHPNWPRSMLWFDPAGDLVHIRHEREGRPQVLTMEKNVIFHWKDVLAEAHRIVATEAREEPACQVGG